MKSIFKRVLVGVLIALILSFIRGNLFIGVRALGVDSQSIGAKVWSVNNTTSWVNASANSLWYNWKAGYIEFSFSINKMNQDSVSPVVTPKNVVLSTSAKDFTCSLGSTSARNSTYVTQVYSVSCPVSLTNAGVTKITINLMPIVATPNETYEIYFNGLLSYVDPSVSVTSNVNVDNSGVISNQNSNTQSIINNQNSNTNQITNEQRNTTNAINNVNNTLTNDNTSSAETKGSNFFSNFQSNGHGLSGIITSPLRLLNSLTTATCSPLVFQLPILHNEVSLPCMKAIYENRFGVFFSLWQLITTGLISYNVCINLYSKVRNLQNPRNDRIEVLNL